ncbi:hypothetical protein AGMMS49944_06690 [Spirochaetia bacterium]|nr:hypothetical protein AGMMS49944_06690 [Spirochaetia bacterium]
MRALRATAPPFWATCVCSSTSVFDSDDYILGVAYGNGKFVAVGEGGKIAYSNPQE